MTGKSLAFTQRDRAVVSEVARFGVMSRDQLMRLKFFASKTRANDRLKRLVAAGYLASRRQPLPVGGPRCVYLPGRVLADGRDVRKRFAAVSDSSSRINWAWWTSASPSRSTATSGGG